MPFLFKQRSTLLPAFARALPSRFRKSRILIVGCGDVGMRIGTLASDRLRLFGSSRSKENFMAIADASITPLELNLLNTKQIRRSISLANRLIMLAPPPNSGNHDPHSQNLVHALRFHRAQLNRQRSFKNLHRNPTKTQLCYVSTTGVYGDKQGAWIDERTPVAPQSERGKRRVAAEAVFNQAARQGIFTKTTLRAPGIYAENRLPIERLKAGTPALSRNDDVYTNHIHALDLARLCLTAIFKAKGSRIYNACDASDLKMGEYFDLVADAFNLPKPIRVSREQLKVEVSPAMLSFMSESRRIKGERVLVELKTHLRYPTVQQCLDQMLESNAVLPKL